MISSVRDCRAVTLLALLTTSCGAPLVKLPTGPGVPAADARDALADATAACRNVSTFTCEIAVSGSADMVRRFPGFVCAPTPCTILLENPVDSRTTCF